MKEKIIALVPAAGTGTRLGDALPKQYLDVNGRPLIYHALDALARVSRISKIVVVLSAQDQHYALSCAAHCNGRRFLNSFLEMRDTHAALIVCLSNAAASQAWISRQPKPAPKTEQDEEQLQV